MPADPTRPTPVSEQKRSCRGCGALMPIGAEELCEPCEDFLANTPEPCPMGCGRTTDDAAGGPCTTCRYLAGERHVDY